jgi:hypothetical protein
MYGLPNEAFLLNMNGGCVTPAALLRMFRASELRWHMHPAQLFSLEILKREGNTG